MRRLCPNKWKREPKHSAGPKHCNTGVHPGNWIGLDRIYSFNKTLKFSFYPLTSLLKHYWYQPNENLGSSVPRTWRRASPHKKKKRAHTHVHTVSYSMIDPCSRVRSRVANKHLSNTWFPFEIFYYFF